MARLSKPKIKEHERVMNEHVETDKVLTQDNVHDVLTHWNPNYGGLTSKNAAIFTPLDIARTLITMTTNIEGKLLDLCAGIGSLLYGMKINNWWRWDGVDEVFAIEYDSEYVRVGKRLFPEVTWINGDIFDLALLHSLPRIDSVVSNPPYGRVPSTSQPKWLSYKGTAHLATVEIAMRLASRGAGFILPQTDLPFKYTDTEYRHIQRFSNGEPVYRTSPRHRYLKENEFAMELTKFTTANPHIHIESVAVDMNQYEWKGAPVTELVSITMEPWNEEMFLPELIEQPSLFDVTV